MLEVRKGEQLLVYRRRHPRKILKVILRVSLARRTRRADIIRQRIIIVLKSS